MKKLLCKIGWHRLFTNYHWKYLDFDGVNEHAQCGWCGFKGILDSNGNLF